ncbi:XrtB/PEP-CTERM-associated transcriptional regulator EpsA [Hydrogenophaga sp. PBL-H3]|uniref:XrtB/PEP-CTERM-associated transcriptional regulator EpsA n=1 Tax=Hydrogenophaga sp. PBL-H3 TaxID=434010 RepID=UPI00131FDB55|nr:XrtB/PEP-CTERM-associated transcriptional regulator EpsA [Hydrogenophaga sp. PBL-H3]QHE75950.1 helix-turn-helix transcriptional regulator [Hydrogenophaga sp. PBL-H3]QHE80374.1 helix-turn-helix transcriptional regulator [Hydrogenophaga sp. PBL-H3]
MNTTSSFVRLNASDLEHLLMTMERALEVQTRSQFFLWAQGALQGFIAHDALWCAHGDIERMRFRVESFSNGVTSERIEAQVTGATDGLLPRLVDDWIRGGRIPRLLSSEGGDQVGRRQLISDLKHCGFSHVAVHGVREMQGEHGSFFVFAGMDHVPNQRDAYLLELLMPHLHLALHRMRMRESGGSCADVTPVTLLSKREIQVLHWVKNGKTNMEIGQILGISPPTVKNHLQKVMRKLNVNNRAQAVGKSATLRLMAHSDLN